MNVADELRRKLLATGRYVDVPGWGLHTKDAPPWRHGRAGMVRH